MIKKLTSTAVATLTILTMMNTGAVFADSKDANEKEPVALVNVEKLNIRSGPSTSYDIIGSFEKEDSVDLISIKDGWYKIKLEDGKKAWTNGQYITLDGEVTVDKLNVRKGPAITYDIVDTKEKEDKVKIVNSDENGWYEIELSDGETGFICGKYIETEAENKHDYSDLYNTNKDTSKSTSSSKSSIKAKSTKSSTKSKKSSSNVVSTMTVSATAYAGDSITATGTTPKVGRTIAVDPSIIPYGTRVYIPALGGTYVAEDCGGGIKGNRIDIFMGSESQCNSWGVRSIEIQILK